MASEALWGVAVLAVNIDIVTVRAVLVRKELGTFLGKSGMNFLATLFALRIRWVSFWPAWSGRWWWSWRAKKWVRGYFLANGLGNPNFGHVLHSLEVDLASKEVKPFWWDFVR